MTGPIYQSSDLNWTRGIADDKLRAISDLGQIVLNLYWGTILEGAEPMNVDDLRKYCLSFPEATENLQWGDDLCFKIRGKIFAIVSLDNPRTCFKCEPDTFAELVEREDIHPAPYVGRYKWVMVDRLGALHSDEMRDLIRQSYEMVVAKALKARSGKRKPHRKLTKEASKRAIRGKTQKKKH